MCVCVCVFGGHKCECNISSFGQSRDKLHPYNVKNKKTGERETEKKKMHLKEAKCEKMEKVSLKSANLYLRASKLTTTDYPIHTAIAYQINCIGMLH